jgi:hypothetical protein
MSDLRTHTEAQRDQARIEALQAQLAQALESERQLAAELDFLAAQYTDALAALAAAKRLRDLSGLALGLSMSGLLLAVLGWLA